MTLFDAILWDFDGVIVDSEKLWLHRAPEFYAAQVGKPIPPEAQKKFVGGSLHNAWTVLSQEYGLRSDFEQFETECVDFAVREMYPHVQLVPGVIEVIQLLQKQETPQAIGTSGNRGWFDPTFARLELSPYFDTVVTTDDVNRKGKPAPDIFLRCAELLNILPQQCLVIEDSTNGCRAGKAAGMTVWGFRNGWNDEQDLSMADWEFNSFSEVAKKLRKN